MGMSRKLFIMILSFVFLSSLMAPVFCAAKERSPDRTGQHPCLNGQDQSHHEHSSADNKKHCPGQSHFCCHSAINVTQSFFFVPDAYPQLSFEILFQPLEVDKTFYHPPQILS